MAIVHVHVTEDNRRRGKVSKVGKSLPWPFTSLNVHRPQSIPPFHHKAE